jgi:hypothetical protein
MRKVYISFFSYGTLLSGQRWCGARTHDGAEKVSAG